LQIRKNKKPVKKIQKFKTKYWKNKPQKKDRKKQKIKLPKKGSPKNTKTPSQKDNLFFLNKIGTNWRQSKNHFE